MTTGKAARPTGAIATSRRAAMCELRLMPDLCEPNNDLQDGNDEAGAHFPNCQTADDIESAIGLLSIGMLWNDFPTAAVRSSGTSRANVLVSASVTVNRSTAETSSGLTDRKN
jgi:hypothetical protein